MQQNHCQACGMDQPASSVHSHTFVIECREGTVTRAALCSDLLQADCFLADGTSPVCMNSRMVMQHCVEHMHSLLLTSCQCLAELRAFRVLGGSL